MSALSLCFTPKIPQPQNKPRLPNWLAEKSSIGTVIMIMHPSWIATGDVNLISKSVKSLTTWLSEFTLQTAASILAGMLAWSLTADVSIEPIT